MWFFILIFFNLLQLAAIKLGRYGEDLLFYLYYMNGGDVLQLLAAVELYVQTILSVLYDLIYCSNEVVDVKKTNQTNKKPQQVRHWKQKLSQSKAGNLFLNTSSNLGSILYFFFHSYSGNQKSVSWILHYYEALWRSGRCQLLLNI